MRFEREAWIGGRLSHPHIVKVYGQGIADGSRYIAMELVEGGSLHAEIERDRQALKAGSTSPSSGRRAQIRAMVSRFVGVADALYAVHRHGIVHRDIKPLNLLVAGDGRLLLSDFGLARDEEASRLTRLGDFMGTVRYMSPEQLLAHRTTVDHRSDIWSLGVSLYEAVTLDLPYSASSEEAYIGAVGTKDPVPARTRNRTVPYDLETILVKRLERDPAARYATAADLRDDLTRYLEDRPVLARRPGSATRTLRWMKRHRVPVAAAVAGTLLGIGALTALETLERDGLELEELRTTLLRDIEDPTYNATRHDNWERLKTRLEDGHLIDAVQGQRLLAAAPLLCPRAVVVVGDEVLERGEQEGAEPAARRVGGAHVVLVEEPHEEGLGQVLGFFHAMAASARHMRRAASSSARTARRGRDAR